MNENKLSACICLKLNPLTHFRFNFEVSWYAQNCIPHPQAVDIIAISGQ